MVRIKTKSTEFLVTPNHNVLVNTEKNQGQKWKFAFRQAKDLSIWDRIPLTSSWDGSPINMEDFVPIIHEENKIIPFFRFLGWYLSEGCCVQNIKIRQQWLIVISQSKKAHPGHYKEIEDTLDALGLHYWCGENHIQFQSREWWKFLDEHFGISHLTKRIPAKFKNVPTELLDVLWDAFVNGDGWEQRNKCSVASTSKRLIDDLQEICLKRGTRLNIYTRANRGSFKTANLLYCGYEATNKFLYLRDWKNNPKFTLVDYDGNVACVEVPNYHTIYVRRNGKPIWCGNCKYIVNDIPKEQKWTEQETEDIEEMESSIMQARNPRTGY